MHIWAPEHVLLTEIFLNMATNSFDDLSLLNTQPTTTTSTTFQTQYNQANDATSASYIPRMARTVPHSSTVHTIFIKKITYPMTSRPDELWILERASDGKETWRPIETFLEINGAFTTTFLRPLSSTSTASLYPVLPHPEHSNVRFGQPVSTVPDHTYLHTTIMLGTLRAAPFPRLSYITGLATMALDSTFFTSWNNSQNYDTTRDFGTNCLYTWTYTT